MAKKLQFRRDTEANWTFHDPKLSAGEIGLELDTHKYKIGNGLDNWSALPYYLSLAAQEGALDDAVEETITGVETVVSGYATAAAGSAATAATHEAGAEAAVIEAATSATAAATSATEAAESAIDAGAHVFQGLFSARPVVGSGRLFYHTTDTNQMFYSDGTNWLELPVQGEDGQMDITYSNLHLNGGGLETDGGSVLMGGGTLDMQGGEIINGVFGAAMYIGEIKLYGGLTAPDHWMVCRGQSLLRADYTMLFNVIGIRYGAADGTHFNLPNMDGKVPVGTTGDTGAYPRGTPGGSPTASLSTGHLPDHTHTIDHDHPAGITSADGAHNHGYDYPEDTGSNIRADGSVVTADDVHRSVVTGTAGAHNHSFDVGYFGGSSGGVAGAASTAFSIMQPYQTVTYIIRVEL